MALRHGGTELFLPVDAVGDPLRILVAQGIRPGHDPLVLRGVERSEPFIQAFFHARATLLDLLLQRRFQVLLLALALVLGEGLVHFRDLIVIQALQQFDGRWCDFPGRLGNRRFGFRGARLQRGIGHLIGLDH
ncbi:hypothetical protein D3C84_668080 [compost metagenome]